ncbi:sodium-dependent transporter [Rhodocaloribacter litoris]|uniref:sodium-dependent transporter n=1 Tax=Rhodocaloribacter litoris TaxID=2558931 RepID=UPI001424A5A3|nr:sodium-dependent transporter [Rhodocaloribacter litoris]QXD16611.1 sodium-dependent transporter [Rhodocaloribacter litoris]GIV59395.1 MAG: transporter [Rhodothermaceae bacterium]
MSVPSLDRGQWSGKLGFILAAAGSAIGLGNIWRFPYTAGENGGGAFVLIYLVFVALIGVPVLLAELAIGRKTQRNPVGAFKALVPASWWPLVGGLGVLTGFGILAFYSVVAGWTLGYLFMAVTGALHEATTADVSGTIFTGLVADPLWAIVLSGLFLVLTIVIVRGGVSGGIERATKILMPLLFLILLALAVRATTLPGAVEGIAYLFKPDFSRIDAGVVMAALGQALFSLSLGMGAMITYGSYLPERENMPFAGVSVAIFDTLIAVLAGLIIFPALFAAGGDPSGGPGLVFIVLPTIFNALPGGTVVAIAFYALLAIAALTSTISLLEVVVSYFVDERGWSREKAAWLIGGLCFVLAVPSALSQGAVAALSGGDEGLIAWDFLTLNNNVWGNYSLSIGAILICIFVGWKWGLPNAIASLEASGDRLPAAGAWGVLVKYVCPVVILILLIFIVATGTYF